METVGGCGWRWRWAAVGGHRGQVGLSCWVQNNNESDPNAVRTTRAVGVAGCWHQLGRVGNSAQLDREQREEQLHHRPELQQHQRRHRGTAAYFTSAATTPNSSAADVTAAMPTTPMVSSGTLEPRGRRI